MCPAHWGTDGPTGKGYHPAARQTQGRSPRSPCREELAVQIRELGPRSRPSWAVASSDPARSPQGWSSLRGPGLQLPPGFQCSRALSFHRGPSPLHALFSISASAPREPRAVHREGSRGGGEGRPKERPVVSPLLSLPEKGCTPNTSCLSLVSPKAEPESSLGCRALLGDVREWE